MVSIVSVFYNRAGIVRRSVDSLLKQQHHAFEIVLVDDGSTDETAEVLRGYSGDPRVKTIIHENLGFTRALKRAVETVAQGSSIAIHGSGDWSHPERIAKQARYLEANPDCGVVGCYYHSVDPQSEAARLVSRRPGTFQDLLRTCPYSHGEVMFTRSAYLQAGGYRPFFKYAQDWDLWLRMAVNCRLGLVEEPLYRKYNPPDSVTADLRKWTEQICFGEVACLDAEQRQLSPQPQLLEPLSLLLLKGGNRLSRRLVQAALRGALAGDPDRLRVAARACRICCNLRSLLALAACAVSEWPWAGTLCKSAVRKWQHLRVAQFMRLTQK